jgi:hypothetical protein
LVHGVNATFLSLAFGRDLGLPAPTLREACELGLVLAVARAVAPSTSEAERLFAAGLALNARLCRQSTATAVAAIESGMPGDPSGKGPGMLASVYALARAFDQLTAGEGHSAAEALQQMNGRLRAQFSPDLLPLFTSWALAQKSVG